MSCLLNSYDFIFRIRKNPTLKAEIQYHSKAIKCGKLCCMLNSTRVLRTLTHSADGERIHNNVKTIIEEGLLKHFIKNLRLGDPTIIFKNSLNLPSAHQNDTTSESIEKVLTEFSKLNNYFQYRDSKEMQSLKVKVNKDCNFNIFYFPLLALKDFWSDSQIQDYLQTKHPGKNLDDLERELGRKTIKKRKNYIFNRIKRDIIFESLWILTNISSATKLNDVMDEKSILDLLGQVIDLILVNNHAISYQASWCVSNIVGDNFAKYRNFALQKGLLQKITKFFEDRGKFFQVVEVDTDSHNLNNIGRCIDNIFRIRPFPKPNFSKNFLRIIKFLQRFIPSNSQTYFEYIGDLYYAIQYMLLSEDNFKEKEFRNGKIFDFICIDRILDLINNNMNKYEQRSTEFKLGIKGPMKVIGNLIESGTIEESHFMVKKGLLRCFTKCLSVNDVSIKKETLWCISNLIADPKKQTEYFIQCLLDLKFYEKALSMLNITEEDIVTIEIAFLVANSFQTCTVEQGKALEKKGVIKKVLEFLHSSINAQMVNNTQEVLYEGILYLVEKDQFFKTIIKEAEESYAILKESESSRMNYWIAQILLEIQKK